MIFRRTLVPALLAGAFLFAQEKITTDVNVVNVFATVRDKKGALIKDLAQSDFAIQEDGRPQTIKYFSKESDLPLTLGLLVDTSGSMRTVLDQERIASYRFFDQVLREDKDQAFVIHFDSEVELLQDLTSSRKLLQKALGQIQVAQPRQLNRRDQDPGLSRPRGGTALYDSVLLASNELMKKQTGRKALIVMTDGEDNSSKDTLTDAITAAQKSNTLVYSIMFSGEQFGSLGGFGGRGMGRRGGMGRPPMQEHHDGKKVLEQLSKETGGGFFDAKKMSLDGIFREIQDELRSQYSLGYTPEKGDGPGYRKLSVTVNKKDMVVQARDGYYADK